MGLRYRVCVPPIKGLRRTVDIAFRPTKVAVEVRGCFWHRCPVHYREPTANREYWQAKVARNVARDEDTEARLADAGWQLIVVWEHESMDEAAVRVAAAVSARRGS